MITYDLACLQLFDGRVNIRANMSVLPVRRDVGSKTIYDYKSENVPSLQLVVDPAQCIAPTPVKGGQIHV